jgi:predicted dehydrogenase
MDKLAEKYNSRWFKTLDDLLADKSFNVDGVIVCSPHAEHTLLGSKALNAGKHLLVEKPMTADIDEAIELVKVSEANPDVACMVNNSANW